MVKHQNKERLKTKPTVQRPNKKGKKVKDKKKKKNGQRLKKGKFFPLRPSVQHFFQIWPAAQKVCPPLAYSNNYPDPLSEIPVSAVL